MPGTRRTFRRTAAGAVALLLGSGALGVGAALGPPAHAAYPDTFNPFAMSGGFTVYAREDALLLNQETEGSIAVGGTATVQGSSGTYTIVHVAAGTGDYTLPSVDGDPTRFLVGSYSPDSTGILAITSAGTTEPALLGDLKMVERDGPWQPFARADWIRLNTNPAQPDQTPLVDATHQQYPDGAVPPVDGSGGNSIYTANTSATAVAEYVESNADASYDAAAECFDGLASNGYPVGVAEDAGARVVLQPLSPDQPNIVDYADIAGTALIQFSPGPAPGVTNPLIIRVPAGTTDVVGARADPQGAHSPYMLWDLSAVTGEVAVTAAEGGRIDGSVYAPSADVTVTAAPLDGQVLGQNVTVAGGEVHSFLFAGQLSCAAVDRGGFAVRKTVEGIAESDLPAGTTFTVNYTATAPDGTVVTGTLEVPADGRPVPADTEFPLGTVVELEEITPESVPGYEWGTPVISPNPLTVGAGTADVVVANTATAQVGTFSVSKAVEDVSGGDPAEPTPGTVPVSWVALSGGDELASGTMQVPFDGTPVAVGQDFPVGTRIVLTEDLSGIDPPTGYEWSGAAWDPGRTFVISEDGATVGVSLTNAITPSGLDRAVTIVKSAIGEAADPAYEYAVSYNTDPPGERTTRPLAVGDHELLDDVEADTDTLRLAELVPTLDGVPVDVESWTPPVITVSVDGAETTYSPANFEGAGPLETAIVEIPLPESGDISIEVANAVKEGTFELSKEFERISGADLPDGTEFTVGWAATTPSDVVHTGTVRLPADGTAVSPLDAAGDAVAFPYGTVVTFEELPPPLSDRIQWQAATFDPASLVIGADGAATVASTLTNSAELATGTVEVAKELVGIDSSELLLDSFTVDYTAWVPGQEVVTGTFQVPVDGTPAGPRDESGDAREFPVGTIVRFHETESNTAALPPGYEWAGTHWHPRNTVVVRSGRPTVLEVTNSVQQLTRWELTKIVQGGGASVVPAGTAFPVEWWWDHEEQPPVSLVPGTAVTSPWLPAGSIVELREGALPEVPGVEWGTPAWAAEGVTLTPHLDGRVALPMSVTRGGSAAELILTNTADTRPLPATGGVSPTLLTAALTMILGGLVLARSRRRADGGTTS